MNKQVEFLIYNIDNTDIKVGAIVRDESMWLSQKAMSALFDVNIPAISKHLKNIFNEGELDEKVVISKMETTTMHGAMLDKTQTREANYYNLDAVISVGYRVNSLRATQFRKWATSVLNEYIRKGFVMDDERLKQGSNVFGKDYFRELLEKVRSIRASERRIWLQITDIFEECSIDYNSNSDITKNFFALVQNKFHFAITSKTASEIVFDNANSQKENMGLTTWKNAPDGRILKSDVAVAKNYLSEKQIKKLERNVSSYFDYVEDLIEQEKVFTMQDFSSSVDKFLAFRDYKVLVGYGNISHATAKNKAEKEYDIFNKTQKINSNFEKQLKKLADKEGESK